jgi:hypothetical protein
VRREAVDLIDNILSGEPIVFEGYLHERAEGRVTIYLHPGLMVDVDEDSCESVEEATDPVTGRTHVRVRLHPDADINATFQPRLARLALPKEAHGVEPEGIPFTAGGLPEGVESGPIYLAAAAPSAGTGGGGGGGGGTRIPVNTATIGEFNTRSDRGVWGWGNDDKSYSDRQTDWRSPA